MPEGNANLSCSDFVRVLASNAPTPGGGGAAALVGAIGTALGNMVGSLTVGKMKYADVEAEIIALKETCDAIQSALLDAIDEDAKAFEPLAKAYGIPKDDPNRAEALEAATLNACEPPLCIMRLCCQGIEAARVFAEKGSRLAVSDAGCAAACLRAALVSASLNVFINTKTLEDQARAEALNAEANAMLGTYVPMADAVFEQVKGGLGQ